LSSSQVLKIYLEPNLVQLPRLAGLQLLQLKTKTTRGAGGERAKMITLLIYSALFCIFILAALAVYLTLTITKYNGPPAGSRERGVSVHVLVLGDIGRSPRMTYHALSVAKHGGKVNVIGYLGKFLVSR
jgi:hypothetical protein